MKIKMTKLPTFLSDTGIPTSVEPHIFKGENTLLQFVDTITDYEKDGYTTMYLFDIHTDMMHEGNIIEGINDDYKSEMTEVDEMLYVRFAVTKE